jgi:ketosteroid isomerase-like protein
MEVWPNAMLLQTYDEEIAMHAGSTSGEDLRDFERFLERREEAAQAFVSGEPAPLGRIVARVLPATFFGPQGGYEQGPDHVRSVYERDAARFISGDTSFEILQIAASNGIAYWVGFQRATARLEGSAEPTPFDLRVTEVFRREGEEWKLVHRHADALASETQAPRQ